MPQHNVLVAGSDHNPRNDLVNHLNAVPGVHANTVSNVATVGSSIGTASRTFDAVFVDADDSDAVTALEEMNTRFDLSLGIYTNGFAVTSPAKYASSGARVYLHTPDDRSAIERALDCLLRVDGGLRATFIDPSDPDVTARTPYRDVIFNSPNAFFVHVHQLPGWARRQAEVVIADRAGQVHYSSHAQRLTDFGHWAHFGGN